MAKHVKGAAIANASSYKLFLENGLEVASQAASGDIDFDLSTIEALSAAGTYKLGVKAIGDGINWLDSALSNLVEYVVESAGVLIPNYITHFSEYVEFLVDSTVSGSGGLSSSTIHDMYKITCPKAGTVYMNTNLITKASYYALGYRGARYRKSDDNIPESVEVSEGEVIYVAVIKNMSHILQLQHTYEGSEITVLPEEVPAESFTAMPGYVGGKTGGLSENTDYNTYRYQVPSDCYVYADKGDLGYLSLCISDTETGLSTANWVRFYTADNNDLPIDASTAVAVKAGQYIFMSLKTREEGNSWHIVTLK